MKTDELPTLTDEQLERLTRGYTPHAPVELLR